MTKRQAETHLTSTEIRPDYNVDFYFGVGIGVMLTMMVMATLVYLWIVFEM